MALPQSSTMGMQRKVPNISLLPQTSKHGIPHPISTSSKYSLSELQTNPSNHGNCAGRQQPLTTPRPPFNRRCTASTGASTHGLHSAHLTDATFAALPGREAAAPERGRRGGGGGGGRRRAAAGDSAPTPTAGGTGKRRCQGYGAERVWPAAMASQLRRGTGRHTEVSGVRGSDGFVQSARRWTLGSTLSLSLSFSRAQCRQRAGL